MRDCMDEGAAYWCRSWSVQSRASVSGISGAKALIQIWMCVVWGVIFVRSSSLVGVATGPCASR